MKAESHFHRITDRNSALRTYSYHPQNI